MESNKLLHCRNLHWLLVAWFSIGAWAAPQSGARVRLNFNVGWKYYLGAPAGSPQDSGYDDSSWESVSIPHTLKLTSLHLDGSKDDGYQKTFHRLVGWYRKHFRVNAGSDSKIFLEFEGSHQVTDVWINGKLAGRHMISGYTPFHFDITGMVDRNADNVVAVRVDNTRNPDVPPDGGRFDYILFGGLYRDVYLVTTDTLHVTFPWEDTYAGVFVTTPTVTPEDATVSVRTTVRNERNTKTRATVVTRILDQDRKVVVKMSQTRDIPAGGDVTFLETNGITEDVHLWSFDNPYLYTAHTTVLAGDATVDTLETSFGIRKLELVVGKGFLLNGKEFKLIGSNRHQQYPYIGNAVPDSLHWKDALAFKQAGFRIVRLAHYPHDNAFLDACDRLGMLVYEEPPTWIEFGNQTWMNNLEEAFRRMIRNHRNHPSVLFWGAGINHLGPVERLQFAAKEEDPTRLTASNGTAWTSPQGSGVADIHTPMISRSINQTEDFIFGIEHGGANNVEALQTIISRAYSMPGLIGLASWTAHDSNTFFNARDGLARWGVWDSFRTPRETFYWYKSELNPEPMVHISSRWASDADSPVRVFCNCEEVELFLNGTSLGRRRPDTGPGITHLHHPSFTFQTRWQPGELRADGFTGGHLWARDSVRTPAAPDHVTVTIDNQDRTFVADGADIVLAYAYIRDNNGTVVPTAGNQVKFTVSGPAEVVGDEKIAANPVAAENGVAAVLIRSGLKPGAITVTASVEGLQPAGATVQSAPFVEDRSAQSYFEPLRVKVDLGAAGQHVQPGWMEWSGTGESRPIQGWTPLSVLGVPAVILEGQAEEAKTFAELGGATVVLKRTTGSGGVMWTNTGDLAGPMNLVAEDGVTAPASDGLSVVFRGLKAGRYQMTTYHHTPGAAAPPGGASATGSPRAMAGGMSIFVDDALGHNRLAASQVRPSSGMLAVTPTNAGPSSAVFTFSVDAGGTATVRIAGGSGNIWLNAFKLTELAK